MARDDEFEDGLRNGKMRSGLRGGAGDRKKEKKSTPKKGTSKRGTPKKGSEAGRSMPTTPRRRGHGGGSGGRGGSSAAATPTRSTRSSTTVGGVAYSAISRRVTTVEETYTGPPAAAFTTLRREGSVKFKELLARLENPLLHIASPRFDLDRPQPTGPVQELEEVDLQGVSPTDSAIDVQTPTWSVLTPAWSALSFSNDTQQPYQQDESMAPVREIGQVERERRRERNQQVEVVSGKQTSPPHSQLSSLSGIEVYGYSSFGRLTPIDSLKDVIHNYYEVQAQVHGYLSETETRDVLANKMQEISQSLDHLARESSSTTITNTFVPPEVVDYVDDGRNPDIYTRDLVEVVQRGNAVLNGKMNAFGSFSKIFADDLRKMSPEMAKAVDEIMDGDGAADGTMAVDVKQENGGGHQA